MAFTDLAKKREYRAKFSAQMYQANCALMESYMVECVDCGEEDPDLLEWDHEYADRKMTVIRAAASSRKALLAEIAKCEVRCANHHRKRHAEEARCGS